MSTAISPYQSSQTPGRDGFPQLLLAEWTKFRTVRGWVVAIFAVAALTALVPIWLSSTATSNDPVTCHRHGCQVEGQQVAVGPAGRVVTDSFYFVHQPIATTGTITAHVTEPVGVAPFPRVPQGFARPPRTEPWAKAGLIIKASTKPGAAYAAVMLSAGHGVRMQYDFTGDIAGMPASGASGASWLRLTRSGNLITGYQSADGRSWTEIGAMKVPGLPASAQAGLFVTAPPLQEATGTGDMTIMTPTQASAVFTGVAMRGGASGQVWRGTSVGTPLPPGPGGVGVPGGPPRRVAPGKPRQGGQAGSMVQHGGRYTVTGSGDIAPFQPIVDPMHIVFIATLFGLLAAIGLGAVFMTAEYRRSMIRTTVTASPRRTRILIAKGIVVGTVTFGAALIGAAIAYPVAEHNLLANGWTAKVWPDFALTSSTGLQVVLGTAAIAGAAAVLGLAAGAIFRRSAGAVTAVIGVIVVPLVLAVVVPLTPATWLTRLTPAAAFSLQATVPRYAQLSNVCAPYHGCLPLSPWQGYLVLCGWAAIALAGAMYLLRRRDV